MNINNSVSTCSYPTAPVIKGAQSQPSENAAVELTATATPAGKRINPQDSKTISVFVQDLPDEAYAVPAWQAGYFRDITHEWLDGKSGDYVDPKNAGFALVSKVESHEYGDLLQKHVKEVYEKNGLMNAGDRYKALSVNKGLDQALHREFTDSISSDPRMMELINKLGLSLT